MIILFMLCNVLKANRLDVAVHAYNTNQGGEVRGIRLYSKFKASPGLY